MIRKVVLTILVVFNLLALVYLITPAPILPDLPYSIKSDEPGDTIQLKNVTAYYTNLTRTEVINFYKANYTGPIVLRLNHPPEKSKQIIRDTIQSYYLEEFILPYRESLFINGFEWEKDVFTKPEKRIKNKLFFKGKEYSAKITLKTFPTPIHHRLIAFYLTEIVILSSVIILLHRES